MDLCEILAPINQSLSSRRQVHLVASHGNARHSSFLAVLIAESLKLSHRVIVLCIHQDPSFYSNCLRQMKLPFCPLSGDIQPLVDSGILSLVDCQDQLINKYKCNPSLLIDNLSTTLCSNPRGDDKIVDFYIDDLSSLQYLGLSLIDSANFIKHCTADSSLNNILIGYHLTNEKDDVCSRLYAHLRSLTRLCFDVRELSTGYTSSLDGEVCLSIFNEDTSMFKKTTYHYNLQSRKILCHPLGTSKMIA